jgi:hypothetical protein
MWVNLALLDTDTDPESGSADLIESGSGTLLETYYRVCTSQQKHEKLTPSSAST